MMNVFKLTLDGGEQRAFAELIDALSLLGFTTDIPLPNASREETRRFRDSWLPQDSGDDQASDLPADIQGFVKAWSDVTARDGRRPRVRVAVSVSSVAQALVLQGYRRGGSVTDDYIWQPAFRSLRIREEDQGLLHRLLSAALEEMRG